MATKTCPSCGGSGYNAKSGVMPGSQPGADLCGTCNGSGYVADNSGSGGVDCFPGDARVLTPNGHAPIQAIRKNDLVVTFDPNAGLTTNRVYRIVKHASHPVWDIRVGEVGNSFSGTSRHPIMTKRGWVRIRDLQTGDVIINAKSDGSIASRQVRSVCRRQERQPVYNIWVDSTFNYVVEGCLAHSFVYFPHLRAMLKSFRPDIRNVLSPRTSADWAVTV